MVYQKLPPCDGDCFHCKRSAEQCTGGSTERLKSPYVKGTEPNRKIGKGDFGAVKVISSGTTK